MNDVRERIVASAYPLYVSRAIRDVSLEEIERIAGVSHADLEREFPTRDALAAECLERRERETTSGGVEASRASMRAKEMARDLIERHRPAGNGASGSVLQAQGAVRSWWAQLTRPTRVLMTVNGAVITGVAALAAALRLLP